MPFVPAPNIVRLEIRATKAGQKIENRLHINCFHEPTMADFSAIHSIVVTSVTSAWVPQLPGDLTLNSNFFVSLHEENGIQLEAPYAAGLVGTNLGQAAPNQNTICVSLRSGAAGRSARGRLYWMGLTEEQYNGNVMDAPDLTAIVGAVDNLRAQLIAGGYHWMIVSYIHNNAPRVGGPVYFDILSVLAVDNVLDSQRRRMPGHGT